MKSRIVTPGIVVLLMQLTACAPPAGETASVTVDTLITGGLVYDGSGESPGLLDIGISEGRISFIGDAVAADISSPDVIDAKGLWVTPGFIDAHSHAELDEDYGKDALPYLYQGITTVVLGLDGDGTSDIGDRLASWEKNGIGVNGIAFVGHGFMRSAVIGREDRDATPDELEEMRGHVRKAMEEGAFGLSTGLFYVPGTYASTDEVIALAQEAAKFSNAIYDTHDRDLGAVYEGVGYDASVEEGIRITEESGLRGIFSHYNLQGAHNYGRADVGARLLNDARDRGVDIWAAQHPYTATQSNLRSYTIPDWASAGSREEMIARFDNPETAAEIIAATNAMLEIRGGADKILFADPRPDLNGKTLADVAAERELSPAETAQWILRDSNAVVMNLELYDHNNTRLLAKEPWMMTCTDGRTPRPDQPITHPRTFGAFPKKMRHFVFEEKLLAPEFVIRSFSGLAADFYRLPDRGYLREGYAADIVVLDPETYRDKATFGEPQQYATGIEQLFVNGQSAIRDGKSTGALAGVPIRRPR